MSKASDKRKRRKARKAREAEIAKNRSQVDWNVILLYEHGLGVLKIDRDQWPR